jgi:hypothetical protein
VRNFLILNDAEFEAWAIRICSGVIAEYGKEKTMRVRILIKIKIFIQVII